jgi:hypothetical protein
MAETIRRITREEFERHGAARHPMALMLMEELEFYEVLDGWYLGALIRDRTDGDFTYAILGPDERGARRWIGGDMSIEDMSEARTRLLAALSKQAEGGRQVHRQE